MEIPEDNTFTLVEKRYLMAILEPWVDMRGRGMPVPDSLVEFLDYLTPTMEDMEAGKGPQIMEISRMVARKFDRISKPR